MKRTALLACVFAAAPMAMAAAPTFEEAKPALDGYTNCLVDYVAQRARWEATATELAEAAFPACSKQRDALEAFLAAPGRLEPDEARQMVASVERDTKPKLIRIVLEERNPLPAPPN